MNFKIYPNYLKRAENCTALTVKYICASNYRPSRVKITQLNSCKSIIIPYQCELSDTLEHALIVLEKLEKVSCYRIIIDNTQNNYFTVAVETYYYTIPDLIEEFRRFYK